MSHANWIATAIQLSKKLSHFRSLTMKRKVLVVDDDAHIREVISFALEQEGIEVSEVFFAELGVIKARILELCVVAECLAMLVE